MRPPTFPGPLLSARAAAVVLAGIIVTLVVHNVMRGKSRRTLVPAASSLEALPEQEKFPEPPPPGLRISLAERPKGDSGAELTNESLRGFLKEEEKRMGIQKIVPAAARAPYEAPGYQPPPPERRSISEARGFMRRMAEEIELVVQARRPPTITLQEWTKPRLLERSGNAAMALGGPIEEDKALRATGTVVKDAGELAELRARLRVPLPDVDFSRQMLLVLHGAGNAIVSAAPDAGQLVVQYRRTAAATDQDTPPFEVRVIDRSDLPVVFQKLPQ